MLSELLTSTSLIYVSFRALPNLIDEEKDIALKTTKQKSMSTEFTEKKKIKLTVKLVQLFISTVLQRTTAEHSNSAITERINVLLTH